MANPKLNGFTKQKLPSTTALRAIQDVGKQGIIDLRASTPSCRSAPTTASVARAQHHNRDASTMNLTAMSP
jgi:lipopolysaccharide export system protein LptC